MTELISIIQQQVGPAFRVEPTTHLMSSGLIDSFDLATLIETLEAYFKISIDPGEIGADNFDTPQQIQHYIQSHR